MNQGILNVDKQEIAKLNINIQGISELKWIGMGEFNLDDNCIWARMPFKNGVALVINKSLKCSTWV